MNRRERKKEETRENIINSAITFFREKGFEETTMEEIADASDVSKGTLYNYFPDKESILIGHFQSFIADYGKEFKAGLEDIQGIEARLNKFLDFFQSVLARDMTLANIYLKFRLQTLFDNDPFDNPRRSGLEKIVQEIMKQAQANKEIRKDIPCLVLARNFQFLVRSYLISNIYTQEPIDMDTLKDQLISLFLNGAKQ